MAEAPLIAIVDYGMGNLFSVKNVCEHVGLRAEITSDPDLAGSAEAIILPGVGAFADAVAALDRLGLSEVIRDAAASGTPIAGICLGMQLLMERSFEFGVHAGLGIVPGDVIPFERPRDGDQVLKVPQVGWNRIWHGSEEAWLDTPLSDTPDGTYQYFVHSYFVRPADPRQIAAVTRYGDVEFCSAMHVDNVFGCQFHPERSGPRGVQIYENIASMLRSQGRGRA